MIRAPIVVVGGHVDHGKCVAGETKVFLADGKLTSIETIFEELQKENKSISCEGGFCIKLQKPLFVFGEDKHKVKSMPVSHIWKLKKDELIKVECENGFAIETTPEHPFPILNNDFSISYISAKDLAINNFILTPNKVPESKTNLNTLKSVIIELLAKDNFIVFVDPKISILIKKHISTNLYSKYNDSFRHNRFRVPVLIELTRNIFPLDELYNNIDFVKQSSTTCRCGQGSIKLGLPRTNDQWTDFFNFLGLFCGDGDNRTGGLCNNDKILLDQYKYCCENIFKVPCKIQKGHTCLESKPSAGKALPSFLQTMLELNTGAKSATIKVSKLIQQAPNKEVSAFIRGYFDTEGYVDLNNGVEVSSNSKQMVVDLSYLLLRFNIRCFIRKNKNAYRLTIKGKTNVFNFAENIGFNLESKQAKLKKYLKIVTVSRVLDQTSITGEQLKQLRRLLGIGNKRLKIPYLEKTEKYDTVTFPFVKEFITKLEKFVDYNQIDALSKLKIKNLLLLINGNLSFSKIIKKTDIENKSKYVFDLTQQKTHNFVANGFLIHNTTLLDYLRGTAIAEREAGRITQHIGATEIPLELIKKQSGLLLEKYGFNLKIPGLLFIDTPGHEAFATLRERGCGIADIGVLVIDILQGVQPQTIEVIKHLKNNKTPFVVAVTKIDKMKGYPEGVTLTQLFKEIDEGKTTYAQEFNEKFYTIMSQLSEYGFDSERFDNNKDMTTKLLLIPLSSRNGVGIPELLLFLSGLSQKYLETNLALDVEGPGKAVVLEINETKGFGKTCDLILYDGKLQKNDFVKIDSKDNLYITKIKQLLRPQALTDLRTVKAGFQAVDLVGAACGLKVVFCDPDFVSPGDEISVITEEEASKLENTKKAVCTLKDKGIIVRADTQGSLDAITSLALKQEVCIGKIGPGNITREDILEARLFARENFIFGAIFAFNIKVAPDIEQLAKQQGIAIFSSDVVYKLFDEYEKWAKELSDKKKIEDLKDVKLPFKLEILKDCVFRKNKPSVFGVKVLDGILKPGNKVIWNGKAVGTIKQIQVNGKAVGEAKKGEEVAVSSDDISFEKDIDLNLNVLLYIYMPSSQREVVQKYLSEDYPELVEELFNLYNTHSL